jgi:hypothetical protein
MTKYKIEIPPGTSLNLSLTNDMGLKKIPRSQKSEILIGYTRPFGGRWSCLLYWQNVYHETLFINFHCPEADRLYQLFS